MQFFIERKGHLPEGPFRLGELRRLIAQGKLDPELHLSMEGDSEWRPLRRFIPDADRLLEEGWQEEPSQKAKPPAPQTDSVQVDRISSAYTIRPRRCSEYDSMRQERLSARPEPVTEPPPKSEESRPETEPKVKEEKKEETKVKADPEDTAEQKDLSLKEDTGETKAEPMKESDKGQQPAQSGESAKPEPKKEEPSTEDQGRVDEGKALSVAEEDSDDDEDDEFGTSKPGRVVLSKSDPPAQRDDNKEIKPETHQARREGEIPVDLAPKEKPKPRTSLTGGTLSLVLAGVILAAGFLVFVVLQLHDSGPVREQEAEPGPSTAEKLSLERIKEIGAAVYLYSLQKGRGRLPNNLKELVELGYLDPESLASPAAPASSAEGFELLIKGEWPKGFPDMTVVEERFAHPNGKRAKYFADLSARLERDTGEKGP